MVADVEVIRDREAHIRTFLADLRRFSDIPEAQFLEHRERQLAVLHALQLAIEAAVDIATHICAADDLGIPSSYAEAFDLLSQRGILDPGLGRDMRARARLRNRIVHFYAPWICRSSTVCCSIDTSARSSGISRRTTDGDERVQTIRRSGARLRVWRQRRESPDTYRGDHDERRRAPVERRSKERSRGGMGVTPQLTTTARERHVEAPDDSPAIRRALEARDSHCQ